MISLPGCSLDQWWAKAEQRTSLSLSKFDQLCGATWASELPYIFRDWMIMPVLYLDFSSAACVVFPSCIGAYHIPGHFLITLLYTNLHQSYFLSLMGEADGNSWYQESEKADANMRFWSCLTCHPTSIKWLITGGRWRMNNLAKGSRAIVKAFTCGELWWHAGRRKRTSGCNASGVWEI